MNYIRNFGAQFTKSVPVLVGCYADLLQKRSPERFLIAKPCDPRDPTQYRSELCETERVIVKAEANGWARQMNQRKRENLVKIITSLEAARA
jgi:hypothetical protein